MNLNPGSVYS
jgi:hypothetical protein